MTDSIYHHGKKRDSMHNHKKGQIDCTIAAKLKKIKKQVTCAIKNKRQYVLSQKKDRLHVLSLRKGQITCAIMEKRLIFFGITTKRQITHAIVEKRLVACANLLSQEKDIHSMCCHGKNSFFISFLE